MKRRTPPTYAAWPLITSDGTLLSALLVLLGLLVLSWGLTGYYWFSLPPEIPLFYSLPVGAEQLAHKEWVWILPVIPTISFIIWLLLYRISLSLYLIYHQLSLWLVTLVSFLAFVSLVNIGRLVF